MRVLVTGGCGYIGSVLVPRLLSLGHEVEVADTQWFGNHLEPHERLVVHKLDVRDYIPLKGIDAIIHLAGIANDPCGELDSKLTWEVNVLGTLRLIDHAMRHKIRHFIYASSGSVYGVKKEERVTEDLSCEPLSDYNKTKMVAERVCLSYYKKFENTVQILRPATVCGVSPRQRLDVAVNTLTAQALDKGVISVLGGDQYRPHVHIEDMVDAYVWMLEHGDFSGIYNVGFENMTIRELALNIVEKTGASAVFLDSNDPRSYRMDSTKLLEAGFTPKRKVADAINDLMEAHKAGTLASNDDCWNIRTMKFLGIGV